MTETFQISLEQARAYDERFVPALFAQWAPTLLDLADLRPGQRLLDVACGTGVVARAAAQRCGSPALVTGVDLNPAMLEVAAEAAPDIDWRLGDALDLPLADERFDVVACQSALMFFDDRARALREMARVLGRDGRLAVQTYAPLSRQPGYGPFVELVVRSAGEEVRELLDLYWSAGDVDQMSSWFDAAGVDIAGSLTVLGTTRFASVQELVHAELRGTPASGRVPDEVLDDVVARARELLAEHVTPGGALEMPIRALFVVGHKG
jgi:ubiquinone/menaquinone biosynthesis C-methylase UbiE